MSHLSVLMVGPDTHADIRCRLLTEIDRRRERVGIGLHPTAFPGLHKRVAEFWNRADITTSQGGGGGGGGGGDF
jgi:hypothetical protein